MLSVLAAVLLAAQTQPAPTTAPKPDPNAPITLNGCVTRDYADSKNANAYTFIDNTDGSSFTLENQSILRYC